ncbi:helix-turn-helix domain-containing protein [Irregularibacter muris]|uniref:Helix-turn-helix domain-containing protein n=1 Tax=Irregularibacter muris TaxID=1796619 RepID=A0AAE3HG06_9FIRM|nr:sugar diacid recognition domain-containing protein [Irregularibacter muris]MCR1898749.1 helix-turn-helix domain-containing protein [Irregularibacter muris]
MNVPQYLAKDIVGRMKEIINQDINYIDTKGVIMASTDEKRIGTFHGGAKRVLSGKNEIIIHYDEEYPGAKQGINLPVYFENNIVGVIGITGKEEEVGRYGKIIQSMTEILIKEAYLVEQKNIGRETKRQFVEELLFRRHKTDEKTLMIRSELLNIKINIPRIVVVARIREKYEEKMLNTPAIYEKIYNIIQGYVDFNKQNLIIQSGMNYIMLLDTNTLKEIHSLIQSIHENIEKKYDIKVCFGIGGISSSADAMRTSYLEARKALDVALTSQTKCIIEYSELDIELFLDEIPQRIKQEYIQKVFRNIDMNQMDEYIEFLGKYFQNNGSITKTAEELYIHKNTVQYKLKRIKALTGYDARNIEDSAILYLAITLYTLEN